MHHRRLLVAYLCAIFCAFANCQDNWDLHKHVNGPTTAESHRQAPGALDNAGIPGIGGQYTGCTISLNCPLDWDDSEDPPWSNEKAGTDGEGPVAELNLTLTLTNSDWSANGLQGCKNKFNELLSKQKEVSHKSPCLPRYLALLEQAEKEMSKHAPKPDQKHLQRRQAIPASNGQREQRSGPRSPSPRHFDLLEYLLSFISQRRTARGTVNRVAEGRPSFRGTLKRMQLPAALPNAPFHLPRTWQQATSSKPVPYRSACEETFCKGGNLDKICGRHKKPDHEFDTEIVCEMCYPKINSVLVKEHCEERARREIQAFHMVCVALAVTIAIAALLYLIRLVCRPLEKPCQIFWRFRTGRTGRVPASPIIASRFSSIFSVESIPAFGSGSFFEGGMDTVPNECEAGDSKTTLSMFQQKVNHLLKKEPRKRIQDVFDLEALPSSPHKEERLPERIPVLPPAPNASVRRIWTDEYRSTVSYQCESSSQDSSEAFVTVHNTRDTADMPPQYTP